MKKVSGNFEYSTNKAPMGALSDSLISSALTYVGGKIEASPAEKDKAVATISGVVKDGIMDNKGLIITGLFIFGLSMAVTNVFVTSVVLRKQ
jgi:hypothetical protein